MNDVTRLLCAVEQGTPKASEQLLQLVYEELRKLAAQKMAEEAPGQTLQATALVHEAWLRLVGSEREQSWNGRGHFFAAAGEAMRRILIDNARRKRAEKHGGCRQRQELLDEELAIDSTSDELFAVDEALRQLKIREPQVAQVIELRFFSGLTKKEIATALGLSERSIYRHWAYGRAWLRRHLDEANEP